MRASWKLSAEQKRDVLRRYRDGEPVKMIAQAMGVSHNAISMLALRAGLPRRRKRKEIVNQTRCDSCGWKLPRFACPHEGCNGVGLNMKESQEL